MLVIACVLIFALWSSRQTSLRRSARQSDRIHAACVEARTIVDLTTPPDSNATLDTSTLSAVFTRLRHLDERLRRMAADEPCSRVVEAIEDVRRVGSLLAAALEAERSLRLRAPKNATDRREQSVERIAACSAELDSASEDLRWLVETVD
ncbi:MAG: hypothetical protein ACR2QK_18845 [Acidimicrobiales bacterium]